jgi:uncharacterized phage-associated protein
MKAKTQKAIDVAYYIIAYANSKNERITHLKLQKILYYLQGIIAATYDGFMLFEDTVYAWPYGPVVRNVYYELCSNGSLPIYPCAFPKLSLTEEMIGTMNKVIDSKIKKTERELVVETRNESPWKMHEEQVNMGEKPPITFGEILNHITYEKDTQS